jgi:hypothetical protein
VQSVVDPQVYELVAELRRRRGGDPDFLAYKEGGGDVTCSPRTSTPT